jgi:ubiquinone/menaquinone biosynthesis C-methylase UbiE
MPDVYADITAAEPAVLETLITAMESRASDPRQRVIRDALFAAAALPDGARVLEAGCGSGAVSRELARRPGIAAVVGLDPSPVFLSRARELAAGIGTLRFEEGDARAMPYADGAFDAVVFHTCLSHVPRPEAALAEAYRVTHPGGCLVILEGDYATTTVAIGPEDPLQPCVEAAMAALVHDRWLVRRLAREVARAGFVVQRFDSHGYVQTAAPDYLLGIVTRGADFLAGWGRIDPATAEALKAEARRRAAAGAFFGFIGFAGIVATRPG